MSPINKASVEDIALAWLEKLGWTVKHSPETAPSELATDHGEKRAAP